MPRKVILDANALMSPFRTPLRLEEELSRLFGSYEAIVPGPIADELHGLAKQRPEAKAAIELVKKRGWKTVQTLRSGARLPKGDLAIVELALELKAAVVTNDRALRDELRDRGVTVAYLRSGKRLEVDEVEA